MPMAETRLVLLQTLGAVGGGEGGKGTHGLIIRTESVVAVFRVGVGPFAFSVLPPPWTGHCKA